MKIDESGLKSIILQIHFYVFHEIPANSDLKL